MEFEFDKDKIKTSLTINQVADLISDFGGEPTIMGDFFIAKTICHNPIGEGSRKLYYYNNTKLFKCFTDCNDTFDIFELICKIKNINKQYKVDNKGNPREWQLFDAVIFIADYFGFIQERTTFDNNFYKLEDWQIFDKYLKTKNENIFLNKKPSIKNIDKDILKNYPKPHIESWESEGIKKEIMDERGICYNPIHHSVLIPHYDINDNLIGIRERTLIKDHEVYGKYIPLTINNKMYNHPLGFNLYNLNNSKDNIKSYKKVIVLEGEKSTLLYASYFGKENDISVAVCGNNFTYFQFALLLDLGVEEIIIAYDKQFKEIGDKEWKTWVEKLKGIHDKYYRYVKISFIFDKENLLQYKDSPTDRGKEKFIELFCRRVYI